jgi:hypothetical protein
MRRDLNWRWDKRELFWRHGGWRHKGYWVTNEVPENQGTVVKLSGPPWLRYVEKKGIRSARFARYRELIKGASGPFSLGPDSGRPFIMYV